MDATLILIDSDTELARARALVDRLWDSSEPADLARLEAQARLIAAYEKRKWQRRPLTIAELIRHLMDQHGLTRSDMVPILGTPSRVSEVLSGKKTTELDNGAEAARRFSPSSRLAPSIGEKSVAARCREEASRGLRFSAQNGGFFVSEWCGRELSHDCA